MRIIILILIFFLPLTLSAQEFNFQFEPEAFPVEIDGWQTFSPWAGGYSETAPDFCDIDADGDLDLFMGRFNPNVCHYRNVGTANSPDFIFYSFAYDSLISLADYMSNPDFWDFDSDNDYDALIGDGYVTYVENLGDQANPDFTSTRDTLFDIDGSIVFGRHVSIVDIDADLDGDLICGEYQGHLQFYRNVGTPDSSAFYLEDDNWLGINVGGNNGNADPDFVDIDNDHDYDLFIGERYGKIWSLLHYLIHCDSLIAIIAGESTTHTSYLSLRGSKATKQSRPKTSETATLLPPTDAAQTSPSPRTRPPRTTGI